MKKILFLILSLLACMNVDAQRAFDVKNSEDGQSVLKVFLPSKNKATGRAIIDCPGGSYSNLCMDYEGTDWAPFYNEMGIAYAVLKYRMPHGNRELPIKDAEQAIRTFRDSAEVWNINPYDVGIMGFSAGGHLASTVATHADFDARPNFQILFYPVISMDQKLGHKWSSIHLLGDDAENEKVVKEFSNEKQIRRHITPPAILFMSDDDRIVPPLTNGVPYYTELRKHDITASLHIYPRGGHGWRFDSRFPYHYDMLHTLTDWLKNLKTARKDAVRVACVGNSITDGSGIDLKDIFGYPAQLQEMLGNDYQVRNFGVSGRTMLNKGDHPYMQEYAWKDCKAFQPNIVIIKLGTNDTKDANWVHKANYSKDMQQMIDELNALPSHPQIYLAYPAKAWKPSWTINDNTIVNEVIPMIDKLAKKNKLKVIDFYTPLSKSDELFVSDGIHPNVKGATVMAETVRDAILNK